MTTTMMITTTTSVVEAMEGKGAPRMQPLKAQALKHMGGCLAMLLALTSVRKTTTMTMMTMTAMMVFAMLVKSKAA